VAFTLALIREVESKLCVDTARIFAAGGSNGGMFTWELGQNPASAATFKAIASLIGLPRLCGSAGQDGRTARAADHRHRGSHRATRLMGEAGFDDDQRWQRLLLHQRYRHDAKLGYQQSLPLPGSPSSIVRCWICAGRLPYVLRRRRARLVRFSGWHPLAARTRLPRTHGTRIRARLVLAVDS